MLRSFIKKFAVIFNFTKLFSGKSRVLLIAVAMIFWMSAANAAVTFNLPSADADGTFTITWSGGASYVHVEQLGAPPPPLVAYGQSSGSVTVTKAPGTYQYRLTNAIGGQSFTYEFITKTIIIGPTNAAPTITDIANIVINENTSTGALAFTVSDTQTAASSLGLTVNSSNTTLVPNGNITLGGSGNSRTIHVTPIPNKTGSSTITVAVSDGVLTVSDTFTLTVNDLPATFTSIPAVSNNGVVAFSWNNAREFVSIRVSASSGNWTTLIGQGGVSGSFTDTRSQTGTYYYQLQDCYFSGGPPNGNPICTSIDERTVVVTLPAPVVSASMSPSAFNEGGTSTLTWSSSNATSCSASGIGGVSATSGSVAYTAPSVMSVNQSISIPVTCIGGGGSTTINAPLTINWINDAPVISPISSRTINEDANTGAIDFTVGDEETATSSLNVTASSSNAALIPNGNIVLSGSGGARTITVTPASNAVGNSIITVNVNDGSLTTSTSFLVTVNAVNDAPIISDINNISINEDASSNTIGFTIGDVDTAAASLIVAASSSNTSLIPNTNINLGGSGAARTVAVTPVTNAMGTSTITVTVSDGALTATDTFIVTVNAVNDAPTVSSPGNATVYEDASTGARSFAINDLETAAASLVVTATSSNTTLISNGNLVLAGTTGTRSINVTPVANVSGSSIITLTVSDGQLTASQNFTVTVNGVNDAPIISDISDSSIDESTSTGARAFTVNDIDTPLTSLAVTASSSNTTLVPSGNITLGGSEGSRTINVTPVPNQSGTAIIAITVSDGVLTASDTFILMVNDLPAKFGSIPASSNNGVYTITWSKAKQFARVMEREASSSTWVNVTGGDAPVAGSVNLNKTQNGTFYYELADCFYAGGPPNGNPTCTLTDTRTVVVAFPVPVVTASFSPATINESPSSGAANTSILTWSATDAQSCSATGISGVSGTAGSTTYTVPSVMTANQTLNAVVTCIGKGPSSTSKAASLVINAVNDLPTFSLITNQSIQEDQINGTGNNGFTVGDEETAVNSLTVTAVSNNQLLIPNANIVIGGSGANRTIKATPLPNMFGSATITLTISDGQASSTSSFVVNVGSVNDEPIISVPVDQIVDKNTSTSVLGVAIGDIETPVTSLTVSAVSDNPNLVAASGLVLGGSGANRSIKVTPVTGKIGIANITVTVSDGQSTTSKIFKVSVQETFADLFDFNNDAPSIFNYSLSASGLPALGTNQMVATTQGNLNVSNGAAGYSVALELPPAVRDLKPNLSLNYNSRSGNGLMGVGWNLGGLSAITRCRANFVTEGTEAQKSNPRYTTGDRLCLDGQKLLVASSTTASSDATYWATGTEYKAELDNFSKIVAYGSSANGGHSYFKIWTKDGRVLTYGGQVSSQNSKIYATNQYGGAVNTWALDKVEDAYGNSYTITYEQNNIRGEYYPSQIQLGATGLVVFTYQARTGQTPWGYDVGNQYQLTNVLDKVTTYVGTTTTTPIKQYHINYKVSATTNRELVERIYECGYESNEWKCAKPLMFDWQLGELGFEEAAKPLELTDGRRLSASNIGQFDDVDGDGYTDIVGRSTLTAWGTSSGSFIPSGFNPETGSQYISRLSLSIINSRQGKRGIILERRNVVTQTQTQIQTHYDVYLAHFNRFSGNVETTLLATSSLDSSLITGDFNNDGLGDFAFTDSIWYQNDSASSVSFTKSVVAGKKINGAETAAIDFNNDGLTDFTYVKPKDPYQVNEVSWFYGHSNQKTHFNNSSSLHYYANPILIVDLPGAPYGKRGSAAGGYRTLVDLNGDGLQDYLYQHFVFSTTDNPGQRPDNWYVRFGTGSFQSDQYYLEPEDTGVVVAPLMNSRVDAFVYSTQYSFNYDYNKDGVEDVILFKPVPGEARFQWNVFYSGFQNGKLTLMDSGIEPFFGRASYLARQPVVGQMDNMFRGDINNDGLSDIVFSSSSEASSWFIYLAAKQQQPDLINKITDGFGATTELSYSPLTGDVNNGSPLYTPDTTAPIFPKQPVNRAMQVVKKISTSNGQGGLIDTYFNYTGGVQDIFRGFGGFKSIAITNSTTNVNSTTEYRQDWPYTGRVKKQTVKDYSGKLISVTDNIYALHAENTRFPYLHSSLQKSYELSTTNESSPLSVSKSINTFDTCGNVTEQSTKVGNGFSGVEVTGELSNQRIVNVYEYYGTPACNDDFLTSSTQEISKASNTDLKTVVTEFIPNSQGEVQTRTDFKGESIQHITTYDREANGVVNTITETAKDIDGTDEPSRVTTFSNFMYGMYPQTITNAENHQTSVTYDYRFGSVKTETVIGLTTTNTYDALGRVQTQQTPDGSLTEKITFYCSSAPVTCPTGAYYGVATQLTHAIQSGKLGAPLSITFYDALQREVRSVAYSLDGKVINQASEYSANGYLTRVSEPYVTNGIVTDTALATAWNSYSSYDALGRANTITGADGGSKTTSYATDVYGLKVTDNILVIKPVGTETQTASRVINPLGQVISVEDALYNTVAYGYDSAGNLETTQVNNNVATKIDMTHDLAGNKTYIKDPDAGVINFDYNGFGELRKQTWQKAIASVEKYITYDYDKLGRQTSRIDKPASGSNVSYAWEWDTRQQGQLSTRSGDGFTENYYYDGFSRLSRNVVTTNGLSGGEFVYTYDNFSRPETVKYPNGFKIQRDYHTAGYQVQTSDVTVAATPKVLWALGNTLDARGNFNNQLWGNGVVTQTGFDSASGRLSSIKSGRLSSANNFTNLYGDIQNLSYSYDTLGNLATRTTARTDNNGLALENTTENFGYDKLNRLKTATTSGVFGRTQTYEYDTGGLGNLVSRSDILTGSSTNNDVGTLAYDQVRNAGIHAVTSANGMNYSYDKYGNMVARGSESIIYDTFNKPTRIAGASITDFYYGPDHELYKEVSGTKTTYKLAGGVYEVIVDGSAITQKSYVDGAIMNNRIYSSDTLITNNTVYIHFDHLGSVEARTNPYGQLANRMSFSPWGERQKQDWSPGPNTDTYVTTNGFTGHDQLDNHSLIHMGGRVYDPNLGRFLSADLFIQSPYDSQSFNRYSYVGNNPLSYIDPTGYKRGTTGSMCSPAADACGSYDSYMDERRRNAFRDSNNQIMFAQTNSGNLQFYGGAIGGVFADANYAEGQMAISLAQAIDGGLTQANADLDSSMAAHDKKLADSLNYNLVFASAMPVRSYDGAVWAVGKSVDELRSAAVSISLAPSIVARSGVSVGVAAGSWGGRLLSALKFTKGTSTLCFVGGTLVHTQDGLKPIEDVQVGDLVVSKSDVTGETTWKPVVELFHNHNKSILNVTLVGDNGRQELLGVTAEHPFWVESYGWVNAGDLEKGNKILSIDGSTLVVESIIPDAKLHETYNFEVTDYHTYFVGEQGAWVHNTCKQLFNSIKDSPNFPKGFRSVQNGTTTNTINNKELLGTLRQQAPGKWTKVYQDGFDAAGNRTSIHYFRNESGKVFDVKTKNYWSNN